MYQILLVLVLAAGPRVPAGVSEKVTAARKACAAGRVEEGIELLAEIVALTGDPNALYNQGRCYQQNGRTEQAINRFREYLRTAPNIPAADALRVRGYIGELEADLEARARRDALARAAAANPPGAGAVQAKPVAPSPVAPKPPAASPPPSPVPAAAETAATEVAPPPISVVPPPVVISAPEPIAAETPAPSPVAWMRPVSIALAVTAVAAVGAAGYFTWRTARAARDLEGPGSLTAPQFKSRWDDGKRSELLARIGYGVGGAALVGSVALYLVSRRSDQPQEARLSLAPFLSSGGAGGLVQVRY